MKLANKSSLFFASALVFTSASASAALISYESFSGYAAGALSGTNPAPAVNGFTGNWYEQTANANVVSNSGSLSHTNPLYPGSTGGSAVTTAGTTRVSRNTTGPLTVTSTTTGTLYLSFLFTGNTHYQALELHNGGQGDGNRTFHIGVMTDGGLSAGQYGFGGSNGSTHASTGTAVSAATQLFVVKFDLSNTAASDSVTVWTNPVLGGTGDPSGGVTINGLDLAWDRMTLAQFQNNNVAQWDEIRWGTDFASVIPEPSSVLLLGGFGIFRLFRRRRD